MKSEIADASSVACNEPRLAFYSGNGCDLHVFDASAAEEIARLKRAGYRYLLLWVGRKDERLRTAVEEDASLQPVREFPGRKGSRAGIYRVAGTG